MAGKPNQLVEALHAVASYYIDQKFAEHSLSQTTQALFYLEVQSQ